MRWEAHKPPRNHSLKGRLSRCREMNISVKGRTSGRIITIPVWFVLEDDRLYLLPVQGSDTQWYRNVLQHPAIRIAAREEEAEPITDPKQVSAAVEKFRARYGAGDVKKYYSKFDVAVLVERQR